MRLKKEAAPPLDSLPLEAGSSSPLDILRRAKHFIVLSIRWVGESLWGGFVVLDESQVADIPLHPEATQGCLTGEIARELVEADMGISAHSLTDFHEAVKLPSFRGQWHICCETAEETISVDATCVICLEHVRIPVTVMVFPCRCMVNIRCCLHCVRDWASTNKPTLKCLFCPCTIDPRQYASLYIKDYFLMRSDHRDDLCCPLGCHYRGTQLELDRHMARSCPLTMMRCRGCGGRFQRARMEHHMRTACNGCRECPICHYIGSLNETLEHCHREHNMLICPWCNSLVPAGEYDAHIRASCPETPVSCHICFAQDIPRKHFRKHLQDDYSRAIRESMTTLAEIANSINNVG